MLGASYGWVKKQLNNGLGAGKVLQVKHSATTVETSTTSTSHVNTSLAVTITPSSPTSKLYIFVHGAMSNSGGNESSRIALGVKEGTTQLTSSNSVGSDANGDICDVGGYGYSPFGVNGYTRQSVNAIVEKDSSNTSSKTYTATIREVSANGTTYLNQGNTASQMTIIEVEQ